MKKILTMLACGLAMASCAAQSDGGGEARIVMPEGQAPKTVIVTSALMKNVLNARSEADFRLKRDTLQVANGEVRFKLDPEGDARYSVEFAPQVAGDFYAAPDDQILMEVSSVNPMNYKVIGTPLMDGLTELASLTSPIEMEYFRLASSGTATEEQVRAVMEKYDAAIKGFIAKNPKSPAVPFAILDLEGEDFLQAFKNLTPQAQESMFMPFAERRLQKVEEDMRSQIQHDKLLSGEMAAPNFTFKDLAGKDVSLSDFKGKWVVIDFWGSWCGWCIKGFPALKEAYKKYGDKLTIIGVACNDTPEDWRAAVKKYELPWIQLYNNQTDDRLFNDYGIQGFPTKAIVNPEGKLVDLTTGEDPAFYDRLASFLK